jgi:hypothetical protein
MHRTGYLYNLTCSEEVQCRPFYNITMSKKGGTASNLGGLTHFSGNQTLFPASTTNRKPFALIVTNQSEGPV